jgi:hypothetical protein
VLIGNDFSSCAGRNLQTAAGSGSEMARFGPPEPLFKCLRNMVSRGNDRVLTGQWIPTAGSFQRYRFCAGIVNARIDIQSGRTRKHAEARAAPAGAQICLLSSTNLPPTHLPKVGESLRISTATRKASALSDPHQLAHRRVPLKMQAAQHGLART